MWAQDPHTLAHTRHWQKTYFFIRTLRHKGGMCAQGPRTRTQMTTDTTWHIRRRTGSKMVSAPGTKVKAASQSRLGGRLSMTTSFYQPTQKYACLLCCIMVALRSLRARCMQASAHPITMTRLWVRRSGCAWTGRLVVFACIYMCVCVCVFAPY